MSKLTNSLSWWPLFLQGFLSRASIYHWTRSSSSLAHPITEYRPDQVAATMLSPVVPPRLTDDDSESTNSTNLTPSMSTVSFGTSTPSSTFASQIPLPLTPSFRGGSLVPYISATPQPPPLTTMQGYPQQHPSYFPQYQAAVPVMQTMQYVQVPQYQPGFATTPIVHPQQGLPGMMATQMQTVPLPVAIHPGMPAFQQNPAYLARPAAKSEQMPTLSKWSAGLDCMFTTLW